MKIAHLICHLDSGGAEAMVRELALEQHLRGHSVHVILIDKPRTTASALRSTQALRTAGVPVYHLGRTPGHLPLRAVFSLRHLLKSSGIQILHTHTAFPDVVGSLAQLRLKTIAVVSTLHNSRDLDGGHLWRVTARTRHHVFCSQSAATANPSFPWPTHTILNGIELRTPDLTNRERTRADLGLGGNDKLLLNVGRISTQKNQFAIGMALRWLHHQGFREYKALSLGRNDLAAGEQARFAEAFKSTGIQQSTTATDLSSLWAAADCFVSASLWEGLPLSLLEALAAGLPCAVSDIPEHREVAQNMAGVFFANPDNPSDFANAIVAACNLGTDRNDLVEGRDLTPFSIDRCAFEYLQLYEALTA